MMERMMSERATEQRITAGSISIGAPHHQPLRVQNLDVHSIQTDLTFPGKFLLGGLETGETGVGYRSAERRQNRPPSRLYFGGGMLEMTEMTRMVRYPCKFLRDFYTEGSAQAIFPGM